MPNHYDTCRDNYCPGCGAAPGNIKNDICEICYPPRARRIPTKAQLALSIRKTMRDPLKDMG